jgi:hypothetical protein
MDILVRDGEAKVATHRKYQPEVSGQMRMYINTRAKLPYQVLYLLEMTIDAFPSSPSCLGGCTRILDSTA